MTALTFSVNPLKTEADTLPARARNSPPSWESDGPCDSLLLALLRQYKSYGANGVVYVRWRLQ